MAAPLETLNYDYNIRGWLLGANRDFAKTTGSATNYFGFDLGYDKNAIANTAGTSLGSYATPAYNGNIEGMVWKSSGDGQIRKYDFSYDAVNRLTAADFNQYTSSTFNKTAGVDFSVSNLTFDANGNILTMNQSGLKISTSSLVDQLVYTYQTNSNKLQAVTDGVNDNSSKLGDFKYDGTAKTLTDYNYDVNGNLSLDNNKKISSITYNYLNLPSVITVTGKGSIAYTYDAAGNKIQKITSETNATVPYNGTNYTSNITTTTTYIGGLVYEAKSYSNVSLSSLNYTDVLQFMGQEEGRIRFIPVAGGTPASLRYDYFLKDHLGNVRMVLTEVSSADIPNYYPAATLEGLNDGTSNTMVNYEKQFYNISSAYIVPEASIPSWPTETTANTKLYYNNNSSPSSNVAPVSPSNLSYPTGCSPTQIAGSSNLYKLNATTNKTGLEFMIHVMAGDHVDIFGKSYYLNTAQITNANSTTLDALTLLTNMLLSPANAAAAKGVTGSQLNTINSGLIPSSFFRGSNSESATTVPKAYINYIFLDEQFKYAGGGASRVGTSGSVKDHWYIDAQLQNILVPKNGYIFVYVSNESNLDVFFDNLQVIHKPGPLLEETHYYPGGLTMAGISSQSAGGLENKIKFQKQELQHKEFSDGSGLEMYEFKYRMDDPQIGRFWSIDPLADKYVYNSTYAFSENKVINGVELEGREYQWFMDKLAEWFVEKQSDYSEAVRATHRLITGTSGQVNHPGGDDPIESGLTKTIGTLQDINSASKPYTDVLNTVNTIGGMVPVSEAGLTAEVLMEASGGALTKNLFANVVGVNKGDIGEALTKSILQKQFKGAEILEHINIKMNGADMIADHVVVKDNKVLGVFESKVDGGKLSNGQKLFFNDGDVGTFTGKNAERGKISGLQVDPSTIKTNVYKWDSKTGTYTVQ
jgi:hypothetical protein